MPAAMTPEEAGARKGKAGDNITTSQRGTSASHTLRRLKRDHPELADQGKKWRVTRLEHAGYMPVTFAIFGRLARVVSA